MLKTSHLSGRSVEVETPSQILKGWPTSAEAWALPHSPRPGILSRILGLFGALGAGMGWV